MSFTKQDIDILRQVIREEVRSEIEPRFDDFRQEFDGKFDKLQTSVDAFLVVSRTTEQEHLVLRAQFTKLRSVLINKRLITEQELTS